MTYNRWDIVLIPFPFTDLSTTKKRPAIVISPENFNSSGDVILMFLTSNVSSKVKVGDHIFEKWEESGLPKPSMSRMKLATIQKDMIIKTIGSVHVDDINSIKMKMSSFFDLK